MKFAAVLEFWFDVDDEDAARRLVKRLAADVLSAPPVSMVEASGAHWPRPSRGCDEVRHRPIED